MNLDVELACWKVHLGASQLPLGSTGVSQSHTAECLARARGVHSLVDFHNKTQSKVGAAVATEDEQYK